MEKPRAASLGAANVLSPTVALGQSRKSATYPPATTSNQLLNELSSPLIEERGVS
jgi:hypothetical protein